MVSYLVPWLFSLFWPQCAHTQSNPFYHPFYPDVTHVRKDTRPSPALPNCKRRKAGRGLGTRLSCPYCSSIHCTMGKNGRTGLYPVLTVHPSTVQWEGMDGLGYTLSLLFIHPLYNGREWTDWVIPCPYCSSIHCTMGENGRTGLYPVLTVHPSTVLWERMDGLGYTLSLLFIHPLYYGREWVCLWCFNVQLGDLGSLRLSRVTSQTHR